VSHGVFEYTPRGFLRIPVNPDDSGSTEALPRLGGKDLDDNVLGD